jgi:hypothetical protein
MEARLLLWRKIFFWSLVYGRISCGDQVQKNMTPKIVFNWCIERQKVKTTLFFVHPCPIPMGIHQGVLGLHMGAHLLPWFPIILGITIQYHYLLWIAFHGTFLVLWNIRNKVMIEGILVDMLLMVSMNSLYICSYGECWADGRMGRAYPSSLPS